MGKLNRKEFFIGLGLLPIASAFAKESSEKIQEHANVKTYGAIGDGKADDTNAFRECLKTNGMAFVPAGTFIVNQLEINGQTLHGIGQLKSTTAPDCLVIRGKGSRITGISFATTNNRAKCEIRFMDGCSDVWIIGCRFEGVAYSAIAADQNGEDDTSLLYKNPVKRVQICQNSFKGYVVPIYAHSVEELLIEQNFFTESYYDAVRLRQGIQKVIISNNQFINIGLSKEEVSRDAVDTYWSGCELILQGNIIKKTGCIGFDLKGVDPDGKYLTRNIIVANNHIEETSFSGILVSCAGATKNNKYLRVGKVMIQGNRVFNCHTRKFSVYEAGIWLRHGVEDAQVVNNHVQGHNGHGISVNNFWKGAPDCRFIQVCQNMVKDCHFKGEASGLYFHNVQHLQVQGNIVEACDYSWRLERIPDSKAFRESSQIQHNYFIGKGKATPDLDWNSYLAKQNKMVKV